MRSSSAGRSPQSRGQGQHRRAGASAPARLSRSTGIEVRPATPTRRADFPWFALTREAAHLSQSLARAAALPLWHLVVRRAPAVPLVLDAARAGAWAALHAALKKERLRAKEQLRLGSVRSDGTRP